VQQLDEILIATGAEPRRIGLYQGDLTAAAPGGHADLLLVSAFPDDYAPTVGSLIGGLHRAGLSVEQLAKDKAYDLRVNFGCWLSQPLSGLPAGLAFDRLLCFEPHHRGAPPEVVGDVFRSLAPFVFTEEIRSVASPLLSSGDMGEDDAVMLRETVRAAAQWMSKGLPVEALSIVVRPEKDTCALEEEFGLLKTELAPLAPEKVVDWPYDLFVSYAHQDQELVLRAVRDLTSTRPGIKIFLDQYELDHGAAWQQQIYDALAGCRRIAAFFSPAYLASKMCQEEYLMARIRHREEEGVLFPLFLFDAKLPLHYCDIQYRDCREGDSAKLRAAVETLALG